MDGIKATEKANKRAATIAMTPADAVKPVAKKAKAKKQLAQIESLNEGDLPTDASADASVNAEANADPSSEKYHVETTAAGGTITFPRSDKKGGEIPVTTPKTGNSNETAPTPPETNVISKTITIKPDQFKTENQVKKTMNFKLDLGDGSFKEI